MWRGVDSRSHMEGGRIGGVGSRSRRGGGGRPNWGGTPNRKTMVWCALGHLREPACWPGPYPKDDLQSPGELEVMINCQAIALNQERKPRTNEREPHVAPRVTTGET